MDVIAQFGQFLRRHDSPYVSFAGLAAPLIIVEPMKLAALFALGEGHIFIGWLIVIGAYAGSIFVVERLFKIVKPKLLELDWFAAAYDTCVALWRSSKKLLAACTKPMRR